ncbi:hypothetical protein HOY34_02465 [Xinfangfangia sp. D13-10-4-6]|uniref:hypothetical protein n=1 Tax=Pseudogemmobacter hezensis TaxID=2737662 RepID=UPI001552E842|nr:hypothetical protein [Pseudogemmobacter hezensis]NPD14061.1 hypothetical protein [Pseudogemmobacter hezensis]
MRYLAPFAVLALALAACGPVPVHVAEEQCMKPARQARAPTGTAGIGIVSGPHGTRTRGDLELNISSDWLLRKDPSAVYETCVMAKSGQAPSRPLYQRSDWKG